MMLKYENQTKLSQEMKGYEAKKQSGYTFRVHKARERVLATLPSIDLERAKIMTESFMRTEGEPMVIRHAKAFRKLCQSKTIFIQDGELIVGSPGSVIRAGILSPDTCWQIVGDELDTISTRAQDPFRITEEQKRLMREFIVPYWKGKSLYDAWLARRPEDIRQLCENKGILFLNAQTQAGNQFTAGYDWIISSGIVSIRRRIDKGLASLDGTVPRDYDKIVYLNALLIVCDGMETLASRYAQLAREEAAKEKDRQRQAELIEIAEICQWVPANPARNFHEALQSLWLYQVYLLMSENGIYAPGRIDQYFYPYYRKDIQEGKITKQQAQELLECLWVKFAETCFLRSGLSAKYAAGYIPYQNVCCGGITKSKQDAVNEVSYMMLQSSMDVKLFQPSLSVKYSKGKNPDSFLHKVVELVALGTGFPAVFNDDIGIKTTMDKGASVEEAYDWNPGGCITPSLMGKARYLNDTAQVNLGAGFELALLNGVNRKTKSRMPVPQTGGPRDFETYEEFKNAVKAQQAYLIKKAVEAAQIINTLVSEQRPMPVVSATHEECIDKALDIEFGGAKYDWGNTFMLVGIQDTVNSLAAVKKLIYDDKKLSWDELLEALDNDFEDYENVRQMCFAAPKYGNDIPEVDDIATEMYEFLAEEVRRYRGPFGGKMLALTTAVSVNVAHGTFVGALPSGRKAGQPLSDGLSPMQGTDAQGPTAILKSVSRINHELFQAGTLLNMKLDPSLFKDEQGISNVMNLVKSMCDLGIYHNQFNVVSQEILMEAQKYPEKHRGLLVRVAGYTAYFVELHKAVQDDIISRTSHGTFVQ